MRRIQIGACEVDPPAALVGVLERMVESGIELGDLLADSGYAHRVAERWALPLRRLGARLVQDLRPHDRGPKGTHMGAILANGALYCPATPGALLELGPLHRGATEAETAAHDTKAAELRSHRLGPIAGYDEDGYHRVGCPAARGKLRCPLRAESMALDRRARLRDGQGPGLKRPLPRLVPADGSGADRAVCRLGLRRPQPADRRRLRGAEGR